MAQRDAAERCEHPLDVVERCAALGGWRFNRAGADEISVSAAGRWTEYRMSFSWLEEVEAVHVACAFDLSVPERKRAAILELVSLANERLWVGHFDLWPGENAVMFRHALLLAGGAEPNGRQCEILLRSAVEACDRYYQAFQFVLWADRTPREAMEGALFETVGEA